MKTIAIVIAAILLATLSGCMARVDGGGMDMSATQERKSVVTENKSTAVVGYETHTVEYNGNTGGN